MSTQPIALPTRSNPRNHTSNANNVDYAMSTGSYTGSTGNGSFNPASYTRHFLGSPISWRSTSFGIGARFQGSPMDAAMGSPGQKPTLGSDVVNAYGVLEREREFCRDYSCCGLHLNDLHALLEHFEEVHVVVIDPISPQAQLQVPFNPQVVSQTSVPPYQPSQPQEPTQQSTPTQSYNSAFDPDEMDIEPPPPSATPSAHSSPGASTPPDSPLSTPLSAYPSPTISGQQPNFYDKTQPPSPGAAPNGVAAFDTKTFLRRSTPNISTSTTPSSLVNANTPITSSQHPNRPTLNLSFPSPASHSHPGTPLSPRVDPFNTYGRYAGEYVGMPGSKDTVDNFGMMDAARAQNSSSLAGAVEECVPPALLYSNAGTPESTPSSSRVPSPKSQAVPSNVINGKLTSPSGPTNATGAAPSNAPKEAAARLAVSMGRPATSLLLSKPFKCPKPNCNKSYKQANGLKYHMTHGSCNFAPPKDLEHVQALLERKRRDRAAAAAAGQLEDGTSTPYTSNPSTPTSPYPDITDAEMREVEREAERRLRPFACGVGDCARRYKNMNGLRYHYQHSGEHGTIGLAMLASGVHECLGNNSSREASAVRGEREGRKPRGSTKSSPTSRATSLSRTATPVSAGGANTPVPQHQPQFTTTSTPSTPYANSQLTYQQRFAEHQRAQYAQQQQQHYHPQPEMYQHPPPQSAAQQPQYASMMYTPNSVGLDVGMAS